MRIVTDLKTVQRNVNIGKYAATGGILLLFGALLLNIYALTRPQDMQLILLVFVAFLVGYTLSNIGGLFNFRWGRRADRGLADALRGVDKQHTLYNHHLGANHVLAGPAGVYVLVPKYQSGPITFENGRWKNPGSRVGLLGFMAPRDALGNPTLEAQAEVEAFKKFLRKHTPELTVEPTPLVVFMNSQAVLEAADAPVTTLHVKQLKDYVRRQAKAQTGAAPSLAPLEAKLGLNAEAVE